jgi:hypothetical protein
LAFLKLVPAYQVGALYDDVVNRTKVTVLEALAALGVQQVKGNARVLDRRVDLDGNSYQSKR